MPVRRCVLTRVMHTAGGGITMHPMRRSVLLVVIAVLCLRVWVGEAMAGHMLAQQIAGAMPAAEAAEHGPDCPGAAMDESKPAGHAECGSCLSCQDCSLNAMTMAFEAQLFARPTAPVRAGAIAFGSNDPRRGHKPPIA
jgi:hypothetical protein